MAGIRAGRIMQLGQESTAGDAVAATTIWRGEVDWIDDQGYPEEVPEDVGYISGLDRTMIPKKLAVYDMPETPATFEQLPIIYDSGVKTVAGVQDGSGTGYIYTYTAHTLASTLNTIKTRTLEVGDNQAVEEMEYGFVEKFTLSGKGGEALKMSATWKGRQVSTASFTTSLSMPTVEEILFGKGLLYIDATNIGTAARALKSSTFMAMDLNVETGWREVFTADGNLYFSFAKAVVPKITLDITFEHDATATAEKVNARAKTSRLVRLKWTGNSLSSAGTAYTAKTLQVDIAGYWSKFDKVGEDNGNDIVKGTFVGKYNATAAAFFETIIVNELTTLP